MRLPFGLGTRAEPPALPQAQAMPRQLRMAHGLTSVASSGDSYREHRLSDVLEVDPWKPGSLYWGMGGGSLDYGPPPQPALKSFRIPRIFRRSVQGWAGLQQQSYTQDMRGGAEGQGAYIPHIPYPYAGRGYRSISMIAKNTGIKGADRIHIPAIFVPTAPLS